MKIGRTQLYWESVNRKEFIRKFTIDLIGYFIMIGNVSFFLQGNFT